jgi:MscS family membrane protein
MLLNRFLQTQFLNNPLQDWCWFVGILLFGLLFRRYGSRFLTRQFFRAFKRFSNKDFSAEFIQLLRKPFELLVLLITLIMAFDRISVPMGWHFKIGHTRYDIDELVILFSKVFIILSITWIALRSADFIAFVFYEKAKDEGDANNLQISKFLKDIIKVFIIITSLLIVLGAIFHFDITGLITGLGIGGLAIALAAQETIANLIGSFIIFLDKPFVVGDLIESDKIKGVVESVGFRSTRIRTLDKTLLTVPNKKLVDSALNNITRAGMRRVRMNINLALSTTNVQLKALKHDIQATIQNHPETGDNYSVNFSDIHDTSLTILVIYHVLTADLDYAAEIKEDINFRIMDIMEKHQTKFAFSESAVIFNKID